MLIRFWGVRGSIPTPLMPSKVRSKISSAVQRIAAKDLESQEARELFLSSLPDYLFSTVGGNTACVEMVTHENCRIIFDAGTGIRELGAEISALRKPTVCHLFLSHFHWDHIQGLPFFTPAFDPRNTIYFYNPLPEFRSILEGQMKPPYFPVSMDVMAAQKEFRVLDGTPVKIGGVEVRYRLMNHPGGSYSYAVVEGGVKTIYATDTELREEDFRRTPENAEFFQDADLLIIDTQYTLGKPLKSTIGAILPSVWPPTSPLHGKSNVWSFSIMNHFTRTAKSMASSRMLPGTPNACRIRGSRFT